MTHRLMTLILSGALALALGGTAAAADRGKDPDRSASKPKAIQTAHPSDKPASASTAKPATTTQATTTTPQTDPVTPGHANPTLPAADKARPLTTASPNSGEQIKWQVLSGGGARGSSASYILTGTVGQTAAGPVASPSYKLNQGFWQNFSGSCCVGTRGNVNMTGIVDAADLASLVSYLTGGGYALPCIDAANINGAGIVDGADLAALTSYLTGGGFVLPSCP